MRTVLLVVLWSCGYCLLAQSDLNERGFDPRVDYNQLSEDSRLHGIPWDDRNLDLTLEELAILPAGEFEDDQKIPIFFRVGFRLRHPETRTSGPGQYPRAAAEVYNQVHGGQWIDGVFVKHEKRVGGDIVNNGEVNFSMQPGSAESAIAINPVNPNLVVSGINYGPGGQGMFYSTDGGQNWTFSSVLSGSCCDPAVSWSPDGSVAYTVTLADCGFFALCAVHFYRSFDNGQTWTDLVEVTNGTTSDKEFIHVDTHATSPHVGNIYVTWHDNNVLKFAKSTNGGSSFDPQVAFSGSQGIGSDIATDSSGNIYYFWPSTIGGTIQVAKSVDGGVSFAPDTQLHDTFAEFDYPIPSFDQRNAFVYVAADVDLSGGTYHDRIYAAWNDTNAPEAGSATNNHSVIEVAYSDNGGASWTISNPHSLADVMTVDRFNPWLEVDNNGEVHVIFYDTRNDSMRRNPDIYHAFSSDGGVTWSSPFRVTAVSSTYINDTFQWGDYAGLSVEMAQIRPSWTDNRSGVEGYTALMSRQTTGGDFSLSSPNNDLQLLCQNETGPAIQVDVTPISGFNDEVTASFQGLPAGFSGNIVGSPLTPPGSFTVDVSPNSAAAGNHAIAVEVTDGSSITHDITINVFVRDVPINTLNPLWVDPLSYDSNWDFDSNALINVLDLSAAVECFD